jgi:hypothetical protein
MNPRQSLHIGAGRHVARPKSFSTTSNSHYKPPLSGGTSNNLAASSAAKPAPSTRSFPIPLPALVFLFFVNVFAGGHSICKWYYQDNLANKKRVDDLLGSEIMEKVTDLYIALGTIDESDLKARHAHMSAHRVSKGISDDSSKVAPAKSVHAPPPPPPSDEGLTPVVSPDVAAPAKEASDLADAHVSPAQADSATERAPKTMERAVESASANSAADKNAGVAERISEARGINTEAAVAVDVASADESSGRQEEETQQTFTASKDPLATEAPSELDDAEAREAASAVAAAVAVTDTGIPLASEIRKEAISEHVAYANSLRHEIESSMLTDLDGLNTAALRSRAAKLASELMARAGWEGVRLFEASKRVEVDLHKKYNHLLEAQKAELENTGKMQIINKEKEIIGLLASQSEQLVLKLQAQLHESLRNQFESLNYQLNYELKSQAERLESEEIADMLYQLADRRRKHITELMDQQDNLLSISDKLLALSKAGSALSGVADDIRNLHQKCAAVYAVESAFSSSNQPQAQISKIVARMSASDNGDQNSELLAAILKSVPKESLAKAIPTVVELKTRFRTVRDELRKVALAPRDAPGIVGQFVGSTLAAVSRPPEGLVAGEGLEETLARAAYYLENGKLYEAVVEVNNIQGPLERKIIEDWNTEAINRLKVDVALTSLKAVSLLIASTPTTTKP